MPFERRIRSRKISGCYLTTKTKKRTLLSKKRREGYGKLTYNRAMTKANGITLSKNGRESEPTW